MSTSYKIPLLPVPNNLSNESLAWPYATTVRSVTDAVDKEEETRGIALLQVISRSKSNSKPVTETSYADTDTRSIMNPHASSQLLQHQQARGKSKRKDPKCHEVSLETIPRKKDSLKRKDLEAQKQSTSALTSDDVRNAATPISWKRHRPALTATPSVTGRPRPAPLMYIPTRSPRPNAAPFVKAIHQKTTSGELPAASSCTNKSLDKLETTLKDLTLKTKAKSPPSSRGLTESQQRFYSRQASRQVPRNFDPLEMAELAELGRLKKPTAKQNRVVENLSRAFNRSYISQMDDELVGLFMKKAQVHNRSELSRMLTNLRRRRNSMIRRYPPSS